MGALNFSLHFPERCVSVHDAVTRKIRSESSGEVYDVWVKGGRDKCTCKGWRYHGHCKHVGLARQDVCLWDSSTGQTQSLQQNVDMVCPACGRETELTPEISHDEVEPSVEAGV